ncbi:MAG: NAD(+)/NADH kinase [Chloroflexota bacterium]|nr:MAG: NAD(+) kinase [Chloroflexota bacterium]
MTPVNRVGVLAHPTRPQTAPIAEQIAHSLEAQGIDVWLLTNWKPEEAIERMPGTEMVIAIGGDGAMLRSARVCAPFAVPVLGVNMGHLGFLTEIQGPEAWDAAMRELLDERYWVEKRMMIDVSVWRDGVQIECGEALNEAVIGRGNVTRLVRVQVIIDGEWATTYTADGLIIATATGSTAYALAAGGPILPPELRNILIVPVAPHLSLDRPMVLPEGAVVDVIVSEQTHSDTVVAVDGELLTPLTVGDRVTIQASEHISRFIRLREPTYFYRSLLDRLEPQVIQPPAPVSRVE